MTTPTTTTTTTTTTTATTIPTTPTTTMGTTETTSTVTTESSTETTREFACSCVASLSHQSLPLFSETTVTTNANGDACTTDQVATDFLSDVRLFVTKRCQTGQWQHARLRRQRARTQCDRRSGRRQAGTNALRVALSFWSTTLCVGCWWCYCLWSRKSNILKLWVYLNSFLHTWKGFVWRQVTIVSWLFNICENHCFNVHPERDCCCSAQNCEQVKSINYICYRSWAKECSLSASVTVQNKNLLSNVLDVTVFK